MSIKKTLILCVGLPRSGKSTWAKTKGYPIVNPDAVRLVLHGKAFIPEAEQMVWTICHYMVRALFLAGHDFVIVVATNTTRKRRDEWISPSLMSNVTWKRGFRVFSTDKDTCIERAIGDGRGDLVDVIDRMGNAFEQIEEDEYEL